MSDFERVVAVLAEGTTARAESWSFSKSCGDGNYHVVMRRVHDVDSVLWIVFSKSGMN